MDFLIFPSLFFKSNSRLLSFERIIKRLQWQEYTRNEKKKNIKQAEYIGECSRYLGWKRVSDIEY